MRWVNLKIKPMKALFGGVDESVESAIAIKLGIFSARSLILKKWWMRRINLKIKQLTSTVGKCHGGNTSSPLIYLTINGADKFGGCAGLAQDAKENDGESVESAIGIKLGIFSARPLILKKWWMRRINLKIKQLTSMVGKWWTCANAIIGRWLG
jgi:hypothetical protein